MGGGLRPVVPGTVVLGTVLVGTVLVGTVLVGTVLVGTVLVGTEVLSTVLVGADAVGTLVPGAGALAGCSGLVELQRLLGAGSVRGDRRLDGRLRLGGGLRCPRQLALVCSDRRQQVGLAHPRGAGKTQRGGDLLQLHQTQGRKIAGGAADGRSRDDLGGFGHSDFLPLPTRCYGGSGSTSGFVPGP